MDDDEYWAGMRRYLSKAILEVDRLQRIVQCGCIVSTIHSRTDQQTAATINFPFFAYCYYFLNLCMKSSLIKKPMFAFPSRLPFNLMDKQKKEFDWWFSYYYGFYCADKSMEWEK